jgi:mevalonate kinase
MPVISASAPGKVILFGEHAVVYNKPAIAVPVNQVKATVYIQANPNQPRGYFKIEAPEIGLSSQLKELTSDNALVTVITGVGEILNIKEFPALTLRVKSTIPIASGLGSGAAVSIAIIRALSSFLGHELANEQISELTYKVEQIYHGNPSGIDNTVITYEQPIYFIRGRPFELLKVASTDKSTKLNNKAPAFSLVICDSGIPSPTLITVTNVKERWQADPQRYESIFNAIENITNKARIIIEQGPFEKLGPLMTENHQYLQDMGVSCEKLDLLVKAALEVGAGGGKLSGGGRGGNIIALSTAGNSSEIASALMEAGAAHTIITHVYPTS